MFQNISDVKSLPHLSNVFEVSGKMAVKIVEKVKCILDMYMFKFSLLFPIKSYDVYTLFSHGQCQTTILTAL